ncbi:cellulose biosynthesis cyclic di-GMP-binding regulatory protein BcsB [Tepidibacter aestuarii]|uniref:cellulose biosynthesis cyclic di-GMP-binding regulatory protein BcsB n=1 Tax=Tepidibacter aestuarii TaxID=2925782 RepID=UPI0020C13D05|nr:cellulose biosynthesis cyclic di-GMP-binding regulatory protein BcsB [Tepidibacter aestuarii]
MYVNGVFSTNTFYFSKDKYAILNDNNYIKINFTQTNKEKYDCSSITVYLNDIPLKSIQLNNFDLNSTFTVPLPKNKITDGPNIITIKSFTKLTEDLCCDELSTFNWLCFHKDTFIHLEYSLLHDATSISDFPYPYIISQRDFVENCYIVIPDNPSLDEAKGAIKMSILLSNYNPYKNSFFRTINYSNIDKYKNSNLIFILDKNNINKYFENNYIVSENEGFIKEIQSPYDKAKKILFISYDIDKSINALSKSKLSRQMLNSSQIIDFELADQKDDDDTDISFKDLNYNSVKLNGALSQSRTFYIQIPKGLKLSDDSYINLNFRYSSILNFENASINVYINDVPVNTKQLSKDLFNNDKLRFKIPKEFLNLKAFNLKVEFYLPLIKSNCDFIDDNVCFATILDSSYIHCSYSNQSSYSLYDYPAPFAMYNRSNSLSLIVEDLSNIDKINLYSIVLSSMNKSSNDFIDFDLYTSINSNLKNDNIILISSADKDTLIKKYNDNLYLQYNDDFSNFISNDKINIVNNNKNDLVSIQLLKSPLHQDKYMLVITSPSINTIYSTKDTLSNINAISSNIADVLILNEKGVKDYAYYREELSKANKKTRWVDTVNFQAKMIFVIVIFILVLISLVIISIIREAQKK